MEGRQCCIERERGDADRGQWGVMGEGEGDKGGPRGAKGQEARHNL